MTFDKKIRYRNPLVLVGKKADLKTALMNTIFPDNPAGSDNVVGIREIMKRLEVAPMWKNLKLSPLMVSQALQELRDDDLLIDSTDGWEKPVPPPP